MKAMAAPGRQLAPATGEIRACHDRKYRVCHQLYDDQLRYGPIRGQER